METTTQDMSDFNSIEKNSRSYETRMRESATQLRRRKISDKDKTIRVKRFRNSKKRVFKKEVRYCHGSYIIIIDEVHNLIGK